MTVPPSAIRGVQPEYGERIHSSFRDPAGYVFRHRGRIYRAIDRSSFQCLDALRSAGEFNSLIERGMLVGTRFTEDDQRAAELQKNHEGFVHFLEHDVIQPITYPYEWCFSMLADAALLTLDLQMELLKSGLSLKDATAYNVQFVEGRATFIDLCSIERPRRLDLWYALGQFGRMFTFPLLLCRYYGWDLRSYFLGSLDGRDVDQITNSLGRLGSWRPRALLDITLPRILARWAEKKGQSGRDIVFNSESVRLNDSAPQVQNLRRLRSKISRLAAGYRPRGVWANYTATCSYAADTEQAKKSLVRQFVQRYRPASVLDLGCNSGDYSFIAAEEGAEVIAVDADHDAVELVYAKVRDRQLPITPMVVDLCNPSPAIGYRNQERQRFLDRVQAECVLALALVHHLRVSGNLPLSLIRDLLWDVTRRYTIVEFVPTDDVMFRHLMRFRTDDVRDYCVEAFRHVLGQRFRLLDEVALPASGRSLFFLEKPSREVTSA